MADRIKRPHKTHGMSKTPTWRTYWRMLDRCNDPRHRAYKWYGARGIKVCARWASCFANFLEDMGERPEGCTLDRIDSDGDYEPGNCKWATKNEQMANMRSNRVITVDGQRMTMTEASRLWHVPVGTLWRRLQLGWDESDAAKRTVRAMRRDQ